MIRYCWIALANTSALGSQNILTCWGVGGGGESVSTLFVGGGGIWLG